MSLISGLTHFSPLPIPWLGDPGNFARIGIVRKPHHPPPAPEKKEIHMKPKVMGMDAEIAIPVFLIGGVVIFMMTKK